MIIYDINLKDKILDQLVEFYHKEEWHLQRISDYEVRKTFQAALEKGNILLSLDADNNIMGYCEYWRINYEQMGRVICDLPFDVRKENITTGNIAWVAGVYIKPEFRSSVVIDYLKTEFFKKTFRCEFFVGEARRKKHAPLKVFKRQEFYDKYAKLKERKNGKQ